MMLELTERDISNISNTVACVLDRVCTMIHAEQCIAVESAYSAPTKVEIVMKLQSMLLAAQRQGSKQLNQLNKL